MSCLKIIIAGSRTITDYSQLALAIMGAIKAGIITANQSFEIIHGGAIGVDMLAARYANDYNYKPIEMKPQYLHKNDRGAPLRRNQDMGNYGDVLVAIWDGTSPGTRHIINYMNSLGKPVHVHIVRK